MPILRQLLLFRFGGWLALLFALSIAGPSAAETGIGVLEDPATRQYTEALYKDWQEGISLDPASGNYVIVYKSAGGSFAQIIYEPATKIAPTVRSAFGLGDNALIEYVYLIRNGQSAMQPIAFLRIDVSSTYPHALSNLASPTGWIGLSACQDSTQCNVGWWTDRQPQSTSGRRGMAADEAANSFSFKSYDLPGIAVMQVRGAARVAAWLGEHPEFGSPIGQQIDALEKKDYVARLAAAPAIPVPSPFDTETILRAIQNHIDTTLINLKLIDPGFASELDRWLQATIAAAKRGNLAAVRGDLNELHQLLEREHKGLDREDDEGDDGKGRNRGVSGRIDRLAAKVLAFDLKYVERRLLSH